jgi:hypothetical protein
MLKRSILVAACAALLTFAGTAQAQESATLVLKSGERISGELVDLGGVGFTMRVNGQQRQVPKGDVSVIEFANAGGAATAEVNNQLSGGKHVVMLRSGEQIAGNLYDISGTSPLKITIDTGSGRRDVNSTEIGRIYLATQSGSAVATSGGTSATTSSRTVGAAGGTITIPANQQWVATGLTVRKGEPIGFNVQGEIRFAGDERATAAGSVNQRRVPGAPLSNELAGALIARIGNGQPFAIGNQTSIPMPESGPLYLGINDDNHGDNSGEFTVTLSRGSRRR